MGIISSIYNSGYNIKRLFLGEQELKLAYLGERIVFNEVIDDLNYVLYEFHKGKIISNTIEAPVKSAILKGNTLVNISPLSGEITIVPNSVQFIESSFIKQNTTFTFIFNCTSAPSTGIIGFRQMLDNATLKEQNINIVQGYNKFKVTTINKEFNKFRFKNDSTSETDFVFNNLLIIEGDYTNIDIPYFEGMQSVKMPVLTTSNEDGAKTNILTVNEDVTLRSNGDVYDELNLLTGRLTQRIDENNEVLAQEVVKTVDLTVVDQDEQTISKLNSFNGTTHVSTEVAENGIYPTIAIEVATE